MRLPKFELVGTWRDIAKLPSVWLGLIFSTIAGYIMAYPTLLFAVIAFFPPEQQFVLAILTFILVLTIVVAVRVIRKADPKDSNDADPEP